MPLPDASSADTTSTPPCGQLGAAALTLLLRERALHRLEAFAGGPRTLADLARETGEPLYRLRRWVLRLTELGVLEVARTEKRGGRPIRHYALTHTDFFIPLELAPVEDLLALAEAGLNERINRNLARELVGMEGIGGYHVHLEAGNSGVLMAHAPFQRWHPTAHAGAALHLRWLSLHLTHGQARQLQDELAEVLARYATYTGPQEYLVALKMVAARDGRQVQ